MRGGCRESAAPGRFSDAQSSSVIPSVARSSPSGTATSPVPHMVSYHADRTTNPRFGLKPMRIPACEDHYPSSTPSAILRASSNALAAARPVSTFTSHRHSAAEVTQVPTRITDSGAAAASGHRAGRNRPSPSASPSWRDPRGATYLRDHAFEGAFFGPFARGSRVRPARVLQELTAIRLHAARGCLRPADFRGVMVSIPFRSSYSSSQHSTPTSFSVA